MENTMFIQACDCTFNYHPFSDHYVNDLIKAGVTCICETVPDVIDDPFTVIKKIYRFRKMVEPWNAIVVKNANDIERAKRERKLAVVMSMQHFPFLGDYYPDDVAILDVYDKLDIKIAQLTYQRRNLIGDGCGEKIDGGLSKFGTKIVEEMNTRGMLIDLSHVGPKTTSDVIELSKDPVVCTHSGCRFLSNHVRNKTNEHIQALADKGGVIGIGKFAPLLNVEHVPTFEDFLNHIDHVIKLVGVDHVGIGLDHTENIPLQNAPFVIGRTPEHDLINWPEQRAPPYYRNPPPGGINIKELLEPEQWKTSVFKGMNKRGYSNSEIEKVLGLNFLKVFKKVWQV